jgi:hypothetical protein
MAIIQFPTTLLVQDLSWGQMRNDMASRSMFGSQTIQLSEPWWTARLVLPKENEDSADEVYQLVMSLQGQKNQLALWNIARPVPRGSMRGSPVLSGAIVAGATSLPITGGTSGGTLRVGDMLGIGTGVTQQVVMVQAPVILNGSGAGTVSVLPPVRNAFATSTAIVWDMPKALFRSVDNKVEWSYSTITMSGLSLDLVEDPRT